MPAKLTGKEFIRRSKEIHGNRYGYSKVEYTFYKSKVVIVCKKHGDFLQTPDNHMGGNNCPKCSGVKSRSTETFVKASRSVHGNKYGYDQVNYKTNIQPVSIHCKKHGYFQQLPSNHLAGNGCKECGIRKSAMKQTQTQEEFLKAAREVHGDLYSYTKVKYSTQRGKITAGCEFHGDFEISAGTHLRGSGCPKCRSTRYSAVAIRWIDQYARTHRMKNVQHAHNGGEFRVPGTRLRVDGYHPATNTVFEFYGDRFHGNPAVFHKSATPHPFSKRTAGQLYRETIRRENHLLSLGYNLITIWENEYRR